MNYNEVLKVINSTIIDGINRISKKLPYDKTFKAKVLEKLSDKKYKVLYHGSEYTVSSEIILATDEIVFVCAPQNNWNSLFVYSIVK